MWRIVCSLAVSLAACTEFPEVDAALATGGAETEYPALVSFDELLAGVPTRLNDQSDDALLARAGALRARADGLRGPVIDPATRDRMSKGVVTP